MKIFFVFFLAVALIVSSMFSILGVEGQYSYGPIFYIERISNVFTNFPETDYLSYSDEWENAAPNYESLAFSYPTWQKGDVEGEGIKEVIQAIGLFFNNIGDMLSSFFSNLIGVFPKLWHNLFETFNYWLTPVRVTVINVSSFIKTLFGARDWFVCAGLALIPCDWQQMVEDKQIVEIPLFGNVNDYPLDQYFNAKNRYIVGGN